MVIVRYKAWLVAQDFSQRPDIDFEETYSPILSATTFRYLISLVAQKGLNLRIFLQPICIVLLKMIFI